MQKFSVLIPAMGHPKAFLPWPGAKSMADAIIQNYLNENCVKIVVVLNERDYKDPNKFSFFPVHPKVHVLLNPNAEKGRFTSIQTGLLSLSPKYPVFLHNVDNPPPPSALISEMLNKLENSAFLIPAYKLTNGHPLLMNSNILSNIKEANENSNLRDILSVYEGKIMPCEFPEVLVNLNTPEEYDRFLNLES